MSPIIICLIGMVVVMGGILVLRLHAFLALLLGALTVAILTPGNLPMAGKDVAVAFGAGCGKVGVVIAMAAIIGQCLLVSGSAERVVKAFLALFGVKRAPLGFLSSGFLLGIPVFFDTVFYLMVPLVRTFAKSRPEMFLVSLLAVVAGGSMAHSLVPPTPGPLMVAEQLDLDLGVMIIAGLILGVITMSVGYLYACWANKKFKIPLRPSAMAAAIEEEVDPNRILPSLKLALLPIVVPFLLIAVGTIVKSGGLASLASLLKLEMKLASLDEILLLLGDKNIALAVGAVIAVLVALKYRPAQMAISEVAQTALAGGGIIILITAAGAAFGGMMKATDIAAELSEMFPQTGSALLLVAFCLTALVRMAQGSATVSMLTSIGIIAPLLSEIELGFHPVYLALAIGCGSKPGPWMNDSGFWVISKMSGMTEGETLKTFSVMLTLMGVAGIIVVLVASKVLPLI